MSDVLTKSIASIEPGTDDADSPTGTFHVILSAETEDRDGDTLRKEDWKTPLPDHITFDTDHGMSVATTVGSGKPSIEDDGNLHVRGTYSSIPRAQEVRTLVNEGHIQTTSVAFMTTKEHKGAGARVVRELLNGAFVAVPSNREAVVLSSKGFEALEHETKAGARHSAVDQGHIQAAHDELTALGATCNDNAQSAANKAFTDPKLKAIVGSLEAKQERVRDALEDAKPGGRPAYLRAVLDSTIVFDSWDSDYNQVTYQMSYSDDGAVVTLTGEPVEVDIHEVIAPDADADREVSTLSASTTAETKTATTSGSTPEAEASGEDPDKDAVELALRALALRARTSAL